MKTRLANLSGAGADGVGGRQDKLQTIADLAERVRHLSPARARAGAAPRVDEHALARALKGEPLAAGVIVIDRFVPLSAWHGRVLLGEVRNAPLHALSHNVVSQLDELLFFDTETTGLAGGAGTLAFIVGMARIEAEQIWLRQFFLTAFKGEAPMLDHASAWLERAGCLVSFNGKSFDAPLLAGRYRMCGRIDPLADKPHLDLLHPTRSAYAKRWDDCRLQTAERRLLKLDRGDDVPGHLIPEAWTRFVRTGETSGLAGILEHNLRDVLSLVALLAALARAYAEPGADQADALGIARAHLRRGGEGVALAHLSEACERLDEAGSLELARLRRRQGDWPAAVAIWRALAARDSRPALESLAKYHEHVQHDYVTAFDMAARLVALDAGNPAYAARHARLSARLDRRDF